MTHSVFIIRSRQQEYRVGRHLFPLTAFLNCLYFTIYALHYERRAGWNRGAESLQWMKDRVARLSTAKKKKHREGREGALVWLHLL